MERHGKKWERNETLLAFELYCILPFGQLHQHTDAIIKLATLIGRSPSSIAMKACNFASLDPVHTARGVSGLSHRGRIDEQIWSDFTQNSLAVFAELEQSKQALNFPDHPYTAEQKEARDSGETESFRYVKVRRVQSFFRHTVLTSYSNRCAITGLSLIELLNASHIIPWSVSEEHRCNPRNGICLNALHDRAFDRGLITFSEELAVVLSPKIIELNAQGIIPDAFFQIEGRQLSIPERFAPDQTALAYHRDNIYQKHTAS